MNAILKTLLAEGAGEGEEGMHAIASVIVNRANRRGLTPEQVVNQPQQFTGRWRKDLDAFAERQPAEVKAAAQRAWERAQTAPIPGIDHYLTTQLLRSSKRPRWATQMGGQREIGQHTFLDSRQPVPQPQERAMPTPTIPGRTSMMTPEAQPASQTPFPYAQLGRQMETFLLEVEEEAYRRGLGSLSTEVYEAMAPYLADPGVVSAIASRQLTPGALLDGVQQAFEAGRMQPAARGVDEFAEDPAAQRVRARVRIRAALGGPPLGVEEIEPMLLQAGARGLPPAPAIPAAPSDPQIMNPVLGTNRPANALFEV